MSAPSETFPEETVEQVASRADELFAPGTDRRVWCVFHTRPRCEKKAAGVCEDLHVRHYLPLRRSTPKRRKGQRRYTFEVPLFTGYLFGCVDPEERYALLCSNFLVRTLEVVDQQLLLRELRSIYLATHSRADLALYPQLRRGRYVRVVSGALTGVVGRISRRKEGLRLVLNITILGTAVAAEMDMNDVELLP